MSEPSRDLEQLQSYQDGELSGLERWRFERRLRGSAALQSELASIRSLSEQIAQSGIGDDPTDSPDLWASIASALPAIDAQVADELSRGARRRRASEAGSEETRGFLGIPIPRIPNWALGSAALAAAATLAVILVSPSPTPPMAEMAQVATPTSTRGIAPVVQASPTGAVRYLNSGGRSVMVIEDPAESMTIVWMMDSV